MPVDQAVILEAFLLIGEFPPNDTRCRSPEVTLEMDLSVIPLLIRSLLAVNVICIPDDPCPGPGPKLPPLLPSDRSVPVLLAPGVRGCFGGD